MCFASFFAKAKQDKLWCFNFELLHFLPKVILQSFKWVEGILLPLSSCWSHICRVWLLQRYWEWFEINLWRPSYLHVTWGDCQGRLSGWTSDRRDGRRIGTWRMRNHFLPRTPNKTISYMCNLTFLLQVRELFHVSSKSEQSWNSSYSIWRGRDVTIMRKL